MSLFSFKPFGSGIKHALIFDIASSSVGVALITHHHKRSTSPIILGTARNPINFKDGNSSKALSTALTEAIMQSIESARKLLAQNTKTIGPFDIHTVVHAPWADATVESATRTFKNPVKITEKVIKKFVASSFPMVHAKEPSITSANITQISLNGYPVKEPNGSEATTIQLSILLSTMHPDIKDAITNTINSSFKATDSNLTTFTYATYKLAEELGTGKSEYLMADIGGEYSQLTSIKDGQLTAKASLDFGTNHVLRAISEKIGTDTAVAKSKFKMYAEGSCTPTECKNIREALNGISDNWAQNFGASCSELSKKTRIPDSIFLFSNSVMYSWFKENMEKIDFSQFTSTSKPFNVEPIIATSELEAFYINSQVTKDRRLLLASLFVDKYDFDGTYEKLFVV